MDRITIFKRKVKVKQSIVGNEAPHHEYIWGSEGIIPRILNLRAR